MVIDKSSATWRKIDKIVSERLANARTELESPGTDIDRTNHLRGVIETYRAVLRLPDPEPDLMAQVSDEEPGTA